MKWFIIVSLAAVVIAWDLLCSILLFAFPDDSPGNQFPERRAAFEEQYRRHQRRTILLKLVVVAMCGIFLALLVGHLTGLLTNESALVLGGGDVGLLSLLFLASFRPWKWTFYSAPAKEN
jgi:hypothetical protein